MCSPGIKMRRQLCLGLNGAWHFQMSILYWHNSSLSDRWNKPYCTPTAVPYPQTIIGTCAILQQV
jgi:hypothetical protein